MFNAIGWVALYVLFIVAGFATVGFGLSFKEE